LSTRGAIRVKTMMRAGYEDLVKVVVERGFDDRAGEANPALTAADSARGFMRAVLQARDEGQTAFPEIVERGDRSALHRWVCSNEEPMPL